jgi:hypothetical protein
MFTPEMFGPIAKLMETLAPYTAKTKEAIRGNWDEIPASEAVPLLAIEASEYVAAIWGVTPDRALAGLALDTCPTDEEKKEHMLEMVAFYQVMEHNGLLAEFVAGMEDAAEL